MHDETKRPESGCDSDNSALRLSSSQSIHDLGSTAKGRESDVR